MRFATRRRLCRTAFIVLCPLPTLLVLAAVLWITSPWYRHLEARHWQREMEATIGLPWQSEQFTWRPGGEVIAVGTTLLDPESRRPLVRIRQLTIRVGDERISIELAGVDIPTDAAARLVATWRNRVLMRGGAAAGKISLRASSVTLGTGEQAISLEHVRAEMLSDDRGAQCLVQFALAGDVDAPPCRLRIVRNRQIVPAGTGWELHTGPSALPCSLLSLMWPQFASLGDLATCCGSWWAEQGPEGWNYHGRGRLSGVSLDRLVTGRFPHKLSGNAVLTVHALEVEQHRLVRCRGDLLVEGGVISQSLLDAAQQSLGLQRPAGRDGPLLVRYTRLGLSFALDGAGLTLAPLGEEPQVILTNQQQPLLAVADTTPIPSVKLIEMLVPQSTVRVPATQQTAALVGWLPLPEIVAPSAVGGRTPYHPLKLRVR